VAISAAPWKAHPVARSTAVSNWRATHTMRRMAKANAAIARDALMDTVVVLSVLMFIALAVGIGVLILKSTQISLPF
jgi:cobalamin biosynthesis protein CobD/CbiB